MKKTVCHVLLLPSWYPTDNNPMSGIFFKEQAMALHRARLKVGVIFPQLQSIRHIKKDNLLTSWYQLERNIEDGIPTYRLHGWNFIGNTQRYYYLWVKSALHLFRAYIKRFGVPDVIHAHCALWGGEAARCISKHYGIPFVVTEHSSAYSNGLITVSQRKLIQDIFSQARAVISVSNAFSDVLKSYMPNERGNLLVVPNLVDTQFFCLPTSKRNELSFSFLHVSLLREVKGVDVLLRAFAAAFKGHSGVSLKIGGDGPLRRELEQLVQTLGINRQVEFLGLLDRYEVRQEMWESNSFVLASHNETFGLVLAESLATGLPVIATRCGGPEDIVNSDVGMLAEPGDIDGLAAQMRHIYSNYHEFDSAKCRQWAEANFSQDSITSRLINIYADVTRASENESESALSTWRN